MCADRAPAYNAGAQTSSPSARYRMSKSFTPFHMAFPVRALAPARHFYAETLGCAVGRESERWIDFNFYGHQISAHLADESDATPAHNEVDGEQIPVRHFGVVLPWADWEALVSRLRACGQAFLIEPGVRFAGQIGEQGTFFLRDPSGNCLEFKAFRDPAGLFARDDRA